MKLQGLALTAKIQIVNIVRILLIWLLAFAFPLQGFAAASKVLCHGSASLNAPVVQDMTDHDQHAARSMHMAEGHGSHHPSTHGLSGDHKCSACAQCVFGMALINVGVQAPEFPVVAPVKVARTLSMHSLWTPSALERPPRSA